MVREEIVFGHVKCLYIRRICGTSKGGYITNTGTDGIVWDSQTNICEPDRHTNEQGVDDTDDDIDSDVSNVCQDHHRLSE
jgi:hypothetical protein